MRKYLALKQIPFLALCLCLSICGCAVPRAQDCSYLYSIVRKEKQVKGGFSKKKAVIIQDFRMAEAYQENIDALKEKASAYIAAHPQLTDRKKEDLSQIRVSPGFSKEETVFLLGEPDKKEKAGSDERWIYVIRKRDAYTVFILPVFVFRQGYYLYFKGDILDKIEYRYIEQVIEETSPPANVKKKTDGSS